MIYDQISIKPNIIYNRVYACVILINQVFTYGIQFGAFPIYISS